MTSRTFTRLPYQTPGPQPVFGTPECKSHRLRQQRRSWSEWLGFSHGLEASTLIEAPRWTITTRDTQVQGGSIPCSCPGDNRLQEHLPCTHTAMARSDPHLIESCQVGIGRINSAPRQSDRLATYFRHQR